MKIPKWAGLDKAERVYWKLLAPDFEKAGTLTNATLPEFLKLVKNLARRDENDKFIKECNPSLTEEKKYMDAAGQEHTSYQESRCSKISRAYDALIIQQMKVFRPKPKEREDVSKKKGLEDLLD